MSTIKTEVTLTRNIEGIKFQLTNGTDDLCEFPGRIGFWICNEHGSSIKIYFDDRASLRKLAIALEIMDEMVFQAVENSK